MKYSSNALALLEKLLSSSCKFPNADPQPCFASMTKAKIRIEQSFSDFGDLDVLLLLEQNEKKQAVFVEAKVKTEQRRRWEITATWAAFEALLEQGVSDSNLFVQLYRKMALLDQVHGNVQPDDAFGTRLRLGDNTVVKKAAEELGRYSTRERAWFLALVPDSPANLERFFSTTFKDYEPDPRLLPSWNWATSNCGYLSWEDLSSFCRENNLRETLDGFEYNAGQLYALGGRRLPPPGPPGAAVAQENPNRPPPPGTPVSWQTPEGAVSAVIKNRGPHTTRIILVGTGETRRVPNGELEW